MVAYKTEQEKFWADTFGAEYIERNPPGDLMSGRIAVFSKILARTNPVRSVIEFGSNIGNNLAAISHLLPQAELSAIEINEKAVAVLKQKEKIKVYHESILDFQPDYQRDLVFTSGVLIHIAPEILPTVYERLFATSKRYICLLEYYNPSPVEIEYRGHRGKLFKRDFAGEMLDCYQSLQLLDYGFVYHRDANFPLGDLTWFILQKA